MRDNLKVGGLVVGIGAVVVIAFGLLPESVATSLSVSIRDERTHEIECSRCGGTMKVANVLGTPDEKVYLCQSCKWALWPDGTWKAPKESLPRPPHWNGD